jgi:hypothetical protein
MLSFKGRLSPKDVSKVGDALGISIEAGYAKKKNTALPVLSAIKTHSRINGLGKQEGSIASASPLSRALPLFSLGKRRCNRLPFWVEYPAIGQ